MSGGDENPPLLRPDVWIKTSDEGKSWVSGSRLLLALEQLCFRSIRVTRETGEVSEEETRGNEVRAVSEKAGHVGLLGMGRIWLLFNVVGKVWNM